MGIGITPRAYSEKLKIDQRALGWLIQFFEIEPIATPGRSRLFDEKDLDMMMERLKKAKENTHS